MSGTVDTDNPTQAEISQLLADAHKEGSDSTRSLNQLYTIARNSPSSLDTELIAEHIRKSDQIRVRERLYSIADVLVRENPEDAASLFGVIRDDLRFPDISGEVYWDHFQEMRENIFDILYAATSAGIEIPPRVLEEMYAGIVEYPQYTSAELTVGILCSLVANDSLVAERATEILTELSSLRDDNQVSRQFRKNATDGLAWLFDEDELPDSADIEEIKQNTEQNMSLFEDSQRQNRSGGSPEDGLFDRLLDAISNGGDR